MGLRDSPSLSDRMMTPEQASEATGLPVAELCARIPHFRIGRKIRRFDSRVIQEVIDGVESVTTFRAHRDFEQKHQAKGLVYFIEAVGADRVKIGFTSKPDAKDRLRELQTAAPFELREVTSLRGSLGIEQSLHRVHAAERVLPTAEWFYMRGTVADLIEHVRTTRTWP